LTDDQRRRLCITDVSKPFRSLRGSERNGDVAPTVHPNMQRELIEFTCAIRLRSMPTAPIFHKVFCEIYGKPCWNVKPGYGSFFTLEFGKPHLDVHEPTVASKNASRSRTSPRHSSNRPTNQSISCIERSPCWTVGSSLGNAILCPPPATIAPKAYLLPKDSAKESQGRRSAGRDRCSMILLKK
jgi:hypothetical protein